MMTDRRLLLEHHLVSTYQPINQYQVLFLPKKIVALVSPPALRKKLLFLNYQVNSVPLKSDRLCVYGQISDGQTYIVCLLIIDNHLLRNDRVINNIFYPAASVIHHVNMESIHQTVTNAPTCRTEAKEAVYLMPQVG